MNLAISFSGGRTSAVMTKTIWDKRHDLVEKGTFYAISIVFCNTGQEHESTLKFVHDCEVKFGWPVVWLEAVVNPEKGKGIRHKIVDFETASRDGRPFYDVVKKYGLPGPTHPQCSSRLKEEVMDSYRHRELGWKRKEYRTAIGIRADEMDRMNESGAFWYPLVNLGYTKQRVNEEIKTWGFDLEISSDAYGNCVWCWKKSLRKLMTVAKQNPELFRFPHQLDQELATYKAENELGERRMFRGHRNTADILRLAREEDFEPYTDNIQEHLFHNEGFDEILDMGSSCGESCEIGAD